MIALPRTTAAEIDEELLKPVPWCSRWTKVVRKTQAIHAAPTRPGEPWRVCRPGPERENAP